MGNGVERELLAGHLVWVFPEINVWYRTVHTYPSCNGVLRCEIYNRGGIDFRSVLDLIIFVRMCVGLRGFGNPNTIKFFINSTIQP